MTKIADTAAERRNSQFLNRRYWGGFQNITMKKSGDTGAERKESRFLDRIPKVAEDWTFQPIQQHQTSKRKGHNRRPGSPVDQDDGENTQTGPHLPAAEFGVALSLYVHEMIFETMPTS